MGKKPDIQLLQAYLDGDCTPGEMRTVERWLGQSPENIDLLEQLAKPDTRSLAGFDRDRVKSELLRKINTHVDAGAGQGQHAESWKTYPLPQKAISKRLVWWVRAAAVILIIASAAAVIYLQGGMDPAQELAYKEITSPVQTVTRLTLSDGSRVTLNANSTLRYPESFLDDERVVYLEGEAFFHVVKNTRHPFRVRSGQLTTTVLGTEFNVNYMPELGKVDVALVEGSVSVEAPGQTDSMFRATLKPNQWISYSDSDPSMQIREGVRAKILWKEGILEFEDKSLAEVARALENWYGMEILIEDSSMAHTKVKGTFKDESLEHILEVFRFVVGIDFTIDPEAGRVVLRKKDE